MRKQAAEAAESAEEVEDSSATVGAEEASSSRSRQSWAMLIKRVYEIDPLSCPQCGGQMKVVAFLEPSQGEVIEEILRHCGLWQASAPRAAPDGDGLVQDLDSAFLDSPIGSPDQADHSQELTYVDIDTFLATF